MEKYLHTHLFECPPPPQFTSHFINQLADVAVNVLLLAFNVRLHLCYLGKGYLLS